MPAVMPAVIAAVWILCGQSCVLFWFDVANIQETINLQKKKTVVLYETLGESGYISCWNKLLQRLQCGIHTWEFASLLRRTGNSRRFYYRPVTCSKLYCVTVLFFCVLLWCSRWSEFPSGGAATISQTKTIKCLFAQHYTIYLVCIEYICIQYTSQTDDLSSWGRAWASWFKSWHTSYG